MHIILFFNNLQDTDKICKDQCHLVSSRICSSYDIVSIIHIVLSIVIMSLIGNDRNSEYRN